MKKFLITYLVVFFSAFSGLAQTGPAGIGSSTNNIIWLDASDLGLSDNDEVTTWSDISGNAANFGTSGSGSTPDFRTGQINGLPVVQFDEANAERLVLNPYNNMASNAISSILVMRTSNNSEGILSYAVGTGGQSNEYLLYNAANIGTYISGSNSNGGSLNDGNFNIFVSKWRSADGALNHFINSTNSLNATDQQGSTITNGGSFAIGGEQDNIDGGYAANQNFTGDIAEIILFNTYLNGAEQAIIENYLSEKYNIVVSNDLFSNYSGSYNADIRGIGTEDGTEKVTTSGFSSGLQINELTNTLDIANEFALFAHDGTVSHADNIMTQLGEAEIDDRWQKDYYLELRGGGTLDGATVNLEFVFDFSEAGLTFSGSASDYVLLYRASTADDFTRVFANDYEIRNGDQVVIDVPASRLQSGYYTLGRGDQLISRTWYALQDGNWSTPSTWTLDAGVLPVPNNPGNETPGNEDNVVIRNGKIVTVQSATNNLQLGSIIVDGRLELTTSSGHDFNQIGGNGVIVMEGNAGASNFPAGNSTASNGFSDGDNGGVLVINGSGLSFSADRTFNDIRINLSNATDELVLGADIILKGDLVVRRGTMVFGDGTTTDRTLTVFGDVEIENDGGSQDGNISTAVADARHEFNIHGNFLNEGTVNFSQRSSPDYVNEAADGIVDVNFVNPTEDQRVDCNGETNFYRIEINKGTDNTYICDIQADAAGNFNLFGPANDNLDNDIASTDQLQANNNALGLITGTLKLGPNIDVPVLNRNVNYCIGANGRLWIDGATVTKDAGTAIVPYGVLEISSGTLTATGNSGITLRINGLIKVDGGNVITNNIRTSIQGTQSLGGYQQTGGSVFLDSNQGSGSASGAYYPFSLTYPGNVFLMSGGTLTLTEPNGRGMMYVNSDPGNISVTGGTVIIDNNNGNNSRITSKAPFYNLALRNSTTNTTSRFVMEGGSSGNGGGQTSLLAQNLVVLNDLILEETTTRSRSSSTFSTYLDFCPDGTNCVDLTVGNNLRIESGTVLDLFNSQVDNVGSSLVTLDGSADATLTIGDITSLDPSLTDYDDPEGANAYNAWEHPFHQVIINKPGATLTLATTGTAYDAGGTGPISDGAGNKNINDTRSNVLKVASDFALLAGSVDLDLYSMRLYGEITNNGILAVDANPINAQVKMREEAAGATRTINTVDGSQFGNLRVNSGDGIIAFSSDVYVKRLLYKHGRIDIGSFNLRVDTMVFSLNGGEVVGNDFGVEDMIIMDGNASDGGLSLYVPANDNPDSSDPEAGNPNYNSRVYFFPIGTGNTGTYPGSRYTPMNLRLEPGGFVDDGYITVSVVSTQLATTGPHPLGNDVLNRYFKISHEGFSTVPKVERLRATVTEADIPDGNNDTEMVDDGSQTWSPGYVLDNSPFTRTSEINDGANGSSGFNDGGVQNINIFFWGNTGSGNPAGGFDLIEANYTAGDPSKFVGAPTVYYSRRNSGWGGRDWDNNTSWYDTPTGTSNPPDFPQAGDIAVVRGNNGQDAINVSGTQEAAQVIFEREGTYADIEDLPRLRFAPGDQLTVSVVSGVGDIYLQQNTTSTARLIGDIGLFASNDTSVIEYYLTENGTYTVQEADFFSKVPTLRIYGQGANYNRIASIDYDIEITNLIVDGESVLEIGGNYDVVDRTRLGFTGGGRIRFPNGVDQYTLSTGEFVTGRGKNQFDNDYRLFVESGGGNGVEHVFEVRENIDLDFNNQNGNLTFDLFTTAIDNNVILRLSTSGTNSLTDGYPAGNSTIDLYKIELNKGADISNTFTIDADFTIPDANSSFQPIEIINGLLVLNNEINGVNGILLANESNFLLPNTDNPDASSGSGGLEIAQGLARIEGDDTGILLDGLLRISGGTLEMSTGSGNGNNFIEYSSTGEAIIELSDGALNVGSQVRRGLTAITGLLNYEQTGGSARFGINTAPESNRGVFEVLNNGSSFVHTAGDFTIVRQNGSTTVGSLIIDPNASLSNITGSVITIGDASTPAGQTDIGINSTLPLNQVVINSDNSPTAKIFVNGLQLNDLTVESGATFNANGRTLSVNNDLTNDGTFTFGSAQVTEFLSDVTQTISGAGSTTFSTFSKPGDGTIDVLKDITVVGLFNFRSGQINTAGNTVDLNGDVNFDGIHTSDVNGPGLVFSGSTAQDLSSFETDISTFGTITIDNTNGVEIPLSGDDYRVTNKLILSSGVFDIGSNLLIMDNGAIFENGSGGTTRADFSTSNMVTVNTSIVDKGIRKIYTDGYSNTFLYPVGLTEYTPVEIEFDGITGTTSNTGFITVKPINGVTDGVAEDNDEFTEEGIADFPDAQNILQYFWNIKSSNVADFDGALRFYHTNSLESVDPIAAGEGLSLVNYAPARLLDIDNTWDKAYSNDLFNEVTNVIEFKADLTNNYSGLNSAGLQGRYTAGITVDAAGNLLAGSAIPNTVPVYETNAAGSGDIDQGTSYVGGIAPSTAESPDLLVSGDYNLTVTNQFWRFRKVTIQSGATLTVTGAGVNLGTVGGEGTLRLVDNSNFPAGDYEDFFPDANCNGGAGLEYTVTTGSRTVLSGGITNVRRIRLSGDGVKTLSNAVNINVCEDLEISDNGTFSMSDGSTFRIKGDIIKDATALFDGDYNNTFLIMDGTSLQSIDGDFTGSEVIQDLELDNAAGLTIVNGANNDVEIEEDLKITTGLISTDANNSLIVKNGATISTFSSTAYVNGPLIRELPTSTATYPFPVGNAGRYGRIDIDEPTVDATKNFEISYAKSTPADDPAINTDVLSSAAVSAGVEKISGNEYWVIDAASTASSNVILYWNSESDVQSTISNLRTMFFDPLGTMEWEVLSTTSVPSGTVTTGAIGGGPLSYSTKYVTFGTTDESTTPLPVTLLYFGANSHDRGIMLDWATASEINNDRFELYRSLDGQEWELIGEVTGNGNANQTIEYQFLDKNPSNGINFYRYKQIDYDGQFEFSPIAYAEYQGQDNYDVLIYPNPVYGPEINLDIVGGEGLVNGGFILFSIDGKPVRQGYTNGRNHNLDLSELPEGIYFLKLQIGDKVYSRKLIKSK